MINVGIQTMPALIFQIWMIKAYPKPIAVLQNCTLTTLFNVIATTLYSVIHAQFEQIAKSFHNFFVQIVFRNFDNAPGDSW